MKTVSALRALILAAAVVLPAALPASAEDGMRKTRDGYAIPISRLDLSQPGDRQIALRDVQTAAHKLCISQQTPNVLMRACAKQIVSITIANAGPSVQKALQLAQTESKGVQYAAR